MTTAANKKPTPSLEGAPKCPPTGKGLTFEKVWAMFQETDKKFKETEKRFKETDKRFKETERLAKETYKSLRETRRIAAENGKVIAENGKQIAENGKQMGGLHRSFGQLAEHLVAPGIEKRFNDLGFHFGGVAPRGYKVIGKDGKISTEIDILLENGETVLAVEVKAKPVEQDIEHHIKRLEILRNHRSSINDKRKILGAIAGAVYEDEVKEAVREAGFFVIEQSGDTMKIDMPEDFVPREF